MIQIDITQEAAEQFREALDAEGALDLGGIRVGVLPGGCSGFQYGLQVEQEPLEDDLVVESAGIRLFVDPFSAQYLDGVAIDYVRSMMGSGFAFENPNSTGGCGCGSSFTV